MRRVLAIAAAAAALVAISANAAVPRAVARAFLDSGVPMSHVAIVVQATDAAKPLFSHQPERPMNPASVMKLVTTFAALDLLGRDYRWKTEAYLDGPLVDGVLHGNLVLKGYGDPKLTIEQWQSLIATLRAKGLESIEGDLVQDRSYFAVVAHDPAAFDSEPLKPYNVGPDALLVNFKSVKFAFAPNAAGDATALVVDPPLAAVSVSGVPVLVNGDCGDWHSAIGAAFVDGRASARASFSGRYSASCGEREWWIALLDHPHYVQAMFETYFRAAGGSFSGRLREGRAPRNAIPFATLESLPLYDIVRDVNKLSNNVMARQLFLTLSTTAVPPPATTAGATRAVSRWLAKRKLKVPGLALENGSGLSRHERVSAGGLARLLLAADASAVRDEFATSLAVAAMDGTVANRFTTVGVAGQALLKTGTLEGVRAIAGYVIDASGRRYVVAALVNDARAGGTQPALDALVQWVYRNGATWTKQSEQPPL
jgi:D-alanyl-D-alanine carboxypeptidase/D-alanyl-D-alanine-endopeptidase (penicillin-binding protein 4)